MKQINGIMMQYFEWYLECKQNLWNNLKKEAPKLAEIGVTAIWMPPDTKELAEKMK